MRLCVPIKLIMLFLTVILAFSSIGGAQEKEDVDESEQEQESSKNEEASKNEEDSKKSSDNNTSKKNKPKKGKSSKEELKSGKKTRTPFSKPSVNGNRRFDDVLSDLLNEFAYDLRINQLKGITNLAVRKVSISDVIPKSYESYLESMIASKVKNNSKIKVLQCPNCKVKKSIIEGDKIQVIIPIHNQTELDNIAMQLGLENWVDVSLIYQESSMVLGINIFSAETKELTWSKVYNTETIYKKKYVEDENTSESDDEEESDSEKKEEPANPNVGGSFAFTVGYHLIPNVKSPSNMLGIITKGSEKFAEGHSEIGVILAGYIDPNTLFSVYNNVEGDPASTGEATTASSAASIKPFTYGLGLMPFYQLNLFNKDDKFDTVRYGINIAAGGIFSTGYISFTSLIGGQIRFAKRFITDFGFYYSAPTTLTLKNRLSYKTKGGIGGMVSFGFQF